MKPIVLNLFMKTFMRERVVPTISASVSCGIFGEHRLGIILLAIAGQQQGACQPFLAGVEELVDRCTPPSAFTSWFARSMRFSGLGWLEKNSTGPLPFCWASIVSKNYAMARGSYPES